MNTTTTVLKRITLFAIALFMVNEANAQLSVSYGLTPTQLVQNILVGTGVTVSNVTYNGDTSAIAKFVGTGSNIGFSSGVMLSTGRADSAVGSNPYPLINSTDFFTTSTDPELTGIASGALNDAAILEFDFVTFSDSIKFRYVFASEEYPDYVCSNFNDVFGFFISGPNPGGGNYVNQNVALIPGTALAVAINTVNPGVSGISGTAGGCTSLAYSSLYNNNIGGTTVSFNGFTVPLLAKAPVTCGQTYHIKIAIADVGDAAFDSGVFLEAGSFSSSSVHIVPQISYGGSNDSVLYEGCGTACIHFVRSTNLSHADTVNLAIAGTATNGSDYNTGVPGTLLPNQLIFQPGQDSLTYCINAVADGTVEGLETILFTVTQTGPCATTTTKATLYINEHSPITVSTRDTNLCNQGGIVTLNNFVNGGVAPYSYSWTNGAGSIQNPTVNVAATTTYFVTVSDACNGTPDPTPAVTDSVRVNVVLLNSMSINAGNDLFVCPGDLVNLTSVLVGGGAPFIYHWSTSSLDTLTSINTPATSLTATTGGLYVVSVRDFCNNVRLDSVNVDVHGSCAVTCPNVISPDGRGPSINDLFYVQNLETFPGSSLVIFNRWGKKLYETSNYQNDWNGSKYSEGTYYYVLTVSDGRSIPGFFQIVKGK